MGIIHSTYLLKLIKQYEIYHTNNTNIASSTSFDNLNLKSKFLLKKVIKFKEKDLHNGKKIIMVQFNITFGEIIITFLRL